jgi:hypothetical protein
MEAELLTNQVRTPTALTNLKMTVTPYELAVAFDQTNFDETELS